MSHVVGIAIEVKDTAALEAAAEKSCALIAVRTTEFDWWGRWMADYHGDDAVYKMGIAPSAYGACEFALVQADSPLGLAELDARRKGRRLTHEEANQVRERHYGPGWRTVTAKPYSIGIVRIEGQVVGHLVYDTMDLPDSAGCRQARTSHHQRLLGHRHQGGRN
jgi:hypothetical protein